MKEETVEEILGYSAEEIGVIDAVVDVTGQSPQTLCILNMLRKIIVIFIFKSFINNTADDTYLKNLTLRYGHKVSPTTTGFLT